MSVIGNILWFVLGGFFMGLAWWAFGVLAFVTIVGIPWGRACFVLGKFAFWPFGRDVVARNELYGRHDIGTGPLGTVGNIVWFVLAGIWPIGRAVVPVDVARAARARRADETLRDMRG